MKIAHRLYLTVLPAVVGVLAVAALAYWGQYARVVPQLLLIIAAAAAIGTLILAWVNVRFVAKRVERLAGGEIAGAPAVTIRGVASAVAPQHVPSEPDELDTIESVVDRLSNAVAVAESGRAAGERAFDERARDYARMLVSIADGAAKQLEEVRLPLHILLENHFGDLNENQEEMLGAARLAAEATDADLVALRQIAELDLGSRSLRRDRILPGDMVRALLPTLQAAAEKSGSTVQADIEPLVPAIRGDQPQLQDSLATLLGTSISAMSPNSVAELTLTKSPDGARLRLAGGGEGVPTIRTALASRIVAASGGSVARIDSALVVTLPK